MLKSIFKHIHRCAQKSNAKPLTGIKSRGELNKIINRERCRVDRNSHAFSLAVFTVSLSSFNGEVAQSLAEILARRLRMTDEVGWLDDEHIAVVLDYTMAEGAWKFASDVCELVCEKVNLSDQSDRLEYRIYTYSSSLPDEIKRRDEDDDERFGGRDGERAEEHFGGGDNKRYDAEDDEGGQGDDQDYDNGNKKRTDRGHNQQKIRGSDKREEESVETADQSVGTEVKSFSSAKQSSAHRPVEGIEPILARKMPFYKRGMDVFGALFGIILLTPLFLVIALLITIVSPGPIFFKQERIGYFGKKFRMWKFRTMRINVDQSEHQKYLASLIKSGAEGTSNNGQSMHKLKNDKRVIPLGNFLRKTAIDELPQLFNVLKGDMSLIGPRPPIPYEVQEYHRWHYGRFDAVPGMTGLWQVSGKNRTTFKEMIRYDIAYSRNMSLRLDARILVGTIPAIVTEIKDTF